MKVTKEYLADRGVVVITVENPPLATTRHTIPASSIANGLVDMSAEIARLTEEATEQLRVHESVSRMME